MCACLSVCGRLGAILSVEKFFEGSIQSLIFQQGGNADLKSPCQVMAM